jgi:hypothetical protein
VNQVFQIQKLERQTETLNFLVTINRLISYNIFFFPAQHKALPKPHFTSLQSSIKNADYETKKKPTEENARRLSLNKIIKSFNKIEAIK